MGLNLRSRNNIPSIRFSYSGFNAIRYLLLAYVEQKDFEEVQKDNYLYHFLNAHEDESYPFKDLISHSDVDGYWDFEAIAQLNEDFSKHYDNIHAFILKEKLMDEKYIDMTFNRLPDFLQKHAEIKGSRIYFG